MVFPVIVSCGERGKTILNRFGRLGYEVSREARLIILSEQFISTSGVSYLLASSKHLSVDKFDLGTTVEAGVLLYERVRNQELMKRDVETLLIMHTPAILADGGPYILGIYRTFNRPRLMGVRVDGSIPDIPGGQAYIYRVRE